MKLILTSAGLSNPNIVNAFLKLLAREPKETSLLVVAYGQNKEENFYINESRKEVENLGFKVVILNMNESFCIDDLQNFDVIYVCGGNTFSILNKMRKTGIDNYIKSQVSKGVIYLGVSAGSIIAGPSIEIAGWGIDGDDNEVGLKNMEGFNFTDTVIFPHFEEERNRDEVEEFKKKVSYPVQELTNEQCLVISKSQKTLI